jgi:hypothetical protein
MTRLYHFERDLERLNRIARMDGLRVRYAATPGQARAWGGYFGVFEGEMILMASNRPDAVRAWMHVRGQGARDG